MQGTLAQRFETAGFVPLALPHLYQAEALLELYGEDLRGRAFLFPGNGVGEELALRPDFTIPVALHHAAHGWENPGRYCYEGPVFRRQLPGSTRPTEYPQAGIENIGHEDRAAADAEILALVQDGLSALGVAENRTITTGDLSIPFALLDALPIPTPRRARLRRHFWRPHHFHRLIAEAQLPCPAPSDARRALIAASGDLIEIERLASVEGEILGTRDIVEVAERARALAAEAEMPEMPAEQAELIEAMLAVRADPVTALTMMQDLCEAAGLRLTEVFDRFERRLEEIMRTGLDPEEMVFDASFGRMLEYYDGFVFEISANARDDLPPLAGGGRYDAITVKLGAAAPVPAVGGMIRPGVVANLTGGPT